MIAASQPLEIADWVVVVIYFLAVFGVAFGAAWRQKAGRQTSAGYFLAGRNVGWFVVGASLFASNIGSELTANEQSIKLAVSSADCDAKLSAN